MNCNIAADLIPLYADGLCSDETAAEMKEHLAECSVCRELLANYKAEIPTLELKETPPKKVFKKVRSYIVISALMIGIVLLSAGIIGIYSLYVRNIGYMEADKNFFGYSPEKIMSLCMEEITVSAVSAFKEDSEEHFRKYFGDISIDDFNVLCKQMLDMKIDTSSELYLRESHGIGDVTDPHCNFYIRSAVEAGGKYFILDVRFKRLSAGRYAVRSFDIWGTENSQYTDKEDLFPRNYHLSVNCDSEASEKYAALTHEIISSEDFVWVFYSYADPIPEGAYTADDGDTITIKDGIMTAGFVKDGALPIYCYNAEIVYRDRTENIISIKTTDNPRLEQYFFAGEDTYKDGVITIGVLNKEYRLNTSDT